MKVSGITFIRNAIMYDYPVREAILSILPLCDECIVLLGHSEDTTEDLILSLNDPKIKIRHSIWDESLRQNGAVLADETNKALSCIAPDTDWVFYIQADEVLHEQYLPVVRKAMEDYLEDETTDGLLFHYHHFYGSYDYIGSDARWYPYEIRIIKPGREIYSYKDAQGFRKGKKQKLKVRKIPAWIHHYGWVKSPQSMQAKQLDFNKYWHNEQWILENVDKTEAYDYADIDVLNPFSGTHPRVMQERIHARNWKFEYDISYNKMSIKEKVKRFLLRYLGWDTRYRNYIRLR